MNCKYKFNLSFLWVPSLRIPRRTAKTSGQPSQEMFKWMMKTRYHCSRCSVSSLQSLEFPHKVSVYLWSVLVSFYLRSVSGCFPFLRIRKLFKGFWCKGNLWPLSCLSVSCASPFIMRVDVFQPMDACICSNLRIYHHQLPLLFDLAWAGDLINRGWENAPNEIRKGLDLTVPNRCLNKKQYFIKAKALSTVDSCSNVQFDWKNSANKVLFILLNSKYGNNGKRFSPDFFGRKLDIA